MKILPSLAAGAVLAASAVAFSASVRAQADEDPALLAALIEEGDTVFHSVGCSGCHGGEGDGSAGTALANNDGLSSRTAVITQIMAPDEEHGQMPSFAHLSDREIAAVATFIRNSWGNEFGIVPEESVALFRSNMGGG